MENNVPKIPVLFQHNRGFVYDVDDYLTLRFTHRLPGNLIGVPATKPRNGHAFALPAVFSIYEVRLAIEKGLIILVDREFSLRRPPDDFTQVEYARLVDRQTSQQIEPIVEKRLKEFKSYLPKIIEGKRRKLLKSGVKEEDISIDPEQLIAEEKRKVEAVKFDRLIQIPMENPLITENRKISSQLPGPAEQVKYKVFRDLWENKSVYISGGDSFGCDFLLYPGDPLYYHASHVVHVLLDPELRLDVKYLVRCCRLSVVVNKICTFAFVNQQGVCYQTMEWEGNVNSNLFSSENLDLKLI